MPAALSQVRAVLFDAVGTLITPEPAVAAVYHAAGQRYGSSLSREDIARRFSAAFRGAREPQNLPPVDARFDTYRVPKRDPAWTTNEPREREAWRFIVANVFPDVEQAQNALFHDLWEHFAIAENWRTYDEVADVWDELRGCGFRVGVASNFDKRLANICRALSPLSRCRDVFWSAQLGARKPDERFFRAIGEHFGLPPSQLLLVGDDFENDYWGARSAGWHALLLKRDGKTVPAQLPRTHVIGSLREVRPLLSIVTTVILFSFRVVDTIPATSGIRASQSQRLGDSQRSLPVKARS